MSTFSAKSIKDVLKILCMFAFCRPSLQNTEPYLETIFVSFIKEKETLFQHWASAICQFYNPISPRCYFYELVLQPLWNCNHSFGTTSQTCVDGDWNDDECVRPLHIYLFDVVKIINSTWTLNLYWQHLTGNKFTLTACDEWIIDVKIQVCKVRMHSVLSSSPKWSIFFFKMSRWYSISILTCFVPFAFCKWEF